MSFCREPESVNLKTVLPRWLQTSASHPLGPFGKNPHPNLFIGGFPNWHRAQVPGLFCAQFENVRQGRKGWGRFSWHKLFAQMETNFAKSFKGSILSAYTTFSLQHICNAISISYYLFPPSSNCQAYIYTAHHAFLCLYQIFSNNIHSSNMNNVRPVLCSGNQNYLCYIWYEFPWFTMQSFWTRAGWFITCTPFLIQWEFARDDIAR